MTELMAAAPDAAHQCPQPGTPVDAVDGSAPVPLRLLWQYEVVQVKIGV
jgi:hypothetical protein